MSKHEFIAKLGFIFCLFLTNQPKTHHFFDEKIKITKKQILFTLDPERDMGNHQKVF